MTDIAPHGLHHVTAIATDPQRNVDFYTGVLGLRLVKTTVNFDDPGTYHLYYGDQAGKPGSLMTFFPWPDAPSGRHGTGQATTTSFSIPETSIGWWKQHLAEHGIETSEVRNSDNEDTLTFRDPDRLQLAGVADAQDDPPGAWDSMQMRAEHAR